MARSPHSGAQEVRERVAARLLALRTRAGLSGVHLAARCGWSPSKVSRIERALTAPSLADIQAWCAATGAELAVAEELADATAEANILYREWRERQRHGLKVFQDEAMTVAERTRVQRVYCANLLPGFFQTAAYTAAVLRTWVRVEGIPDDVDQAVERRAERARLLRSPEHRFVVVVEQAVLSFVIGGPAAMRDQLTHLIAVSRLPAVRLGVIPAGVDRSPHSMLPLESFYLFDSRAVMVELVTAQLDITARHEVALYGRCFAELESLAVYGRDARDLIAGARARITA
jgi:transcriptional regulator with XRE-family HTH domain